MRWVQVSRLVTASLIALAVVVSLWSVRPPAVVPDTAPATEFSSARAMQHVRIMAERPRPVGSSDNARVRKYLMQLLASLCSEVQLQHGEAQNARTMRPEPLQNIVGRIHGTGRGPAVLLLCHYDSVRAGPGAGDDASGVAAVLETLRAIRAAAPLRNDLIVLITDGEEAGMLGAQVFVAGHPWLRDVKLVMNFEARGCGGPALLMQTGYNNGWLVREFARTAPYPFGSSFAEDVFRRMPNDTDFTIFRNAGKTGLNFAFFKGLHYYHTDQDTVANLDERSVQHHGSYCLALARHFGNLPLDQTDAHDYAFFNLFGSVFVCYPLVASMPVAGVASAAFCAALIVGWRRRRLSAGGLAGGFLCFTMVVVASPAAVAAAWWAASKLPVVAQSMSRGDVPWADAVSLMVSLLTLAIFLTVHGAFGRKVKVEDRAAGALIAWFILTVFSAWFVPRGHYFFSWPLLFSSGGLLSVLITDDRAGWRVVLFGCSCLPGILLVVPGTYLISITVGAGLSWATAICVAVLLGLLTLSLELVFFPSRVATGELAKNTPLSGGELE